jgi:speckle-type POZ protein
MKPSGWIGFFLHLNHNHGTGVQANFQFSLLNRVGVPSYCSGNQKVHTFKYADAGWGPQNFIKRKTREESVYLKDDCFRVRCDVTVWTAVRTGSIPRILTVSVTPSDMHQHMGRLLESQVGTDVTFHVNEETFAAHRPVLASVAGVHGAALWPHEGDDHKPRTDR